MISWKYKLWRTAGTAAALSLAACGGEGGASGEAGHDGEAGEAAAHGEAGEAIAPVAEAASAGGGGEQGEAGVASAYAGLSGDQLTALRLQHLKGFLLVAGRVAEGDTTEEAGVLVSQGLLEVYDPAADQFGALSVDAVRAAADGANLSRQQMTQRIRAGETAIDAARGALQIDNAALTARMVDISSGLYQHVIQADFVDPIEYQHSLGAALAARDALTAGERALRAQNATAYREALAELNRYIELWPAPTAPEQPASYSTVLAASSRVRLALSPFL